MPSELSDPSETLSVSEILDALGINCVASAKEAMAYLVIPGNYGPRWLIPARSRACAPVLSAWRPYSISSRTKWLALRTAARMGLLQLTGSVSSVAISRAGSLRWFERCAIPSRSGEMVILVGNPSPGRKVIIFLPDEAQRVAAVLKVGVTAAGGVNVLHEAEVLGRLDQYSWAPKVLSIHSDLRAAAQEFVPGALANREFRSDYLSLLCGLPRSGRSMNLADFVQAKASALRPFIAELDKIAPDILNRSLACIDLDIAIPTLLVHGDFAPWNIRITPASGLVLVDWESADFAGLPGEDLFHFHFSDDRLFGSRKGGSPAQRATPAGTEYLRRMDLDTKLWPRLAIAYLLNQLEANCSYSEASYATYGLRQLAAIVDSVSV